MKEKVAMIYSKGPTSLNKDDVIKLLKSAREHLISTKKKPSQIIEYFIKNEKLIYLFNKPPYDGVKRDK